MIKKICKLIPMDFKSYIFIQLKCILLAIVYTVSALIFPMFISFIIDDGIVNNDTKKIILYICLMFFIGILMIVSQYLQRVYFYQFSQRIIIDIKSNVFKNLLRTNTQFWKTNKVGDIFTVLEDDIPKLETVVTSTLSQLIINFLSIIGICIFLLMIDKEIGICTIIISFIFSVFQKKLGNQAKKGMFDIREIFGEINGFTSECLNSMNDIQISGYSTPIHNEYRKKNQRYMKKSIYQTKIMSLNQVISLLYNVIGICLTLSLGGYKVYCGTLSIGMLFTITLYVQRLYSPIVNFNNSYISIKTIGPIIDKILHVMDTKDVIESGEYIKSESLKGNIVFRDIYFSYDEREIFKNINIKINHGEIVGIIGSNGCGKTTLIKLLGRLHNQLEGEILIDDREIKEYDLSYLRTQIGYMSQNNFLLSGKLRDIINPLQKDIEDIEILKMMDRLQINIDRFKDGLDTEIGENKITISGGESQKIGLIRLSFEDKPILILDEPTSAIDISSEVIICRELEQILSGKTVIIITHKKKILNICTRIIDMEKIQSVYSEVGS